MNTKLTYARARLWLGISGVGFWVMLSTATIFFGLGDRLLAVQPPLYDIKVLSIFLLIYIGLSAPFDFLGGYWLPHRFHRSAPALHQFLFAWLRGVIGQALILLFSGLIILAAGRAGGRIGSMIAVVSVMIFLLAVQGILARWIGGLRAVSMDLQPYQAKLDEWQVQMPRTMVYRVTDPAFVGGFIGLPDRETLVLPSSWLQSQQGVMRFNALPPETVVLQIIRRLAVLERGNRWRGILLALVWNGVGFYLATWLPRAGVNTVVEVINTACGFTLWSFLGLLILPTFSRPAVFASDAFALQRGVPMAVLEKSITSLDKLQDDEPSRSTWIETIFHPIPSVNSRITALQQNSGEFYGAWQSARVALFLSWGCVGLLSRAVHCNSGRPELWVLFPGD